MIIEIDSTGNAFEIKSKTLKPKTQKCYILISLDKEVVYEYKGHNTSVAQRFKTTKLIKSISKQMDYKLVDLLNSDQLSFSDAVKHAKTDDNDESLPKELLQIRQTGQLKKKTKAVLEKSEKKIILDTKILDQVKELAINSENILDYVVSNFKLYRVDQNDNDFEFVPIEGAGNGIFDAPNYYTKIIFKDTRVVAITLWRIEE